MLRPAALAGVAPSRSDRPSGLLVTFAARSRPGRGLGISIVGKRQSGKEQAVNEHAVRLIVSDDLRRGHGSVFFRAWLALPLFLWLAIWAVAAFFAAIANWVATLATGRSPDPLHHFLARFVRCATHAYAYYNLAAEPLPSFDGKPGYRIDLEIDPPRRQNRWTVAFRIVLALPALLVSSAVVGSTVYFSQASFSYNSFGLLTTASFLGWFVALAHGRMPRGLRDLVAYALSYGAQVWAYLLLLTDRYPNSDPQAALAGLPVHADPIGLTVGDDRRRNRLTVFFRLLLALPHLVWLVLWALIAYLAAIVNWVATLVRGTSPTPLHRFLAAYVRYQNHVYAYLFLVANPFPGFAGAAGRYPVDPTIEGPRIQNRWKVGFRAILAVPALLLAGAYGSLLLVVAILGWFASLATGRLPLGLRNAGALALRYGAQTNGYALLLTDRYPYSGPTGGVPPTSQATPESMPSSL
jgi:hypothetical protein